jgi:hypothetical protein
MDHILPPECGGPCLNAWRWQMVSSRVNQIAGRFQLASDAAALDKPPLA